MGHFGGYQLRVKVYFLPFTIKFKISHIICTYRNITLISTLICDLCINIPIVVTDVRSIEIFVAVSADETGAAMLGNDDDCADIDVIVFELS